MAKNVPLIIQGGNDDPLPPGSIAFSTAGNVEILRFDPDGSIYIRGEKQTHDVTNEELRAGFLDWVRSHLSAVSLRIMAEQRVAILEEELREVIKGYRSGDWGNLGEEADRLERLLNTTFYKDI